MAATFALTNQATGLSYRFMRFGEMDKTAATTYRNVFGTSGKLYSITINNAESSAEDGLIKFFDTVADVTHSVGVYSLTPSLVLPFPVAATGVLAVTTIFFPEGLTFSNGLAIAIGKDASTDYAIKAANDLADDVTSVVLAFK